MLFGQLIQRMPRGLSTHLVDGGHGLQIADDRVVRAKIEADIEQNDRVPLLIIDGKEITWDEFGRMLMTFEGFQFKLEVADKSEEL